MASGKSSDMVDLALSAMALAVYSRTQQVLAAGIEASATYDRLLAMVQNRIVEAGIASLNEADIDSCLLTIFLMGRFEGATHLVGGSTQPSSVRTLQSWSHHDGAQAILKLWYDNWSRNKPSSIIMQTRRGLIRSSILRSLPLPYWMLDGQFFGEQGTELDRDRIIIQITNLRHRYACLPQEGDVQISELDELNQEAKALHEVLLHESVEIRKGVSCERVHLKTPGPWPRRHFYSSLAYNFSPFSRIFSLNWHWTALILLTSTRWKMITRMLAMGGTDSSYKQEEFECAFHLGIVCDNIAAAVPFCLERFKVVHSDSNNDSPTVVLADDPVKPYLVGAIAWPLSIAASVKGIDAKQQEWFRSELAELGRINGDGGLECVANETTPQI